MLNAIKRLFGGSSREIPEHFSGQPLPNRGTEYVYLHFLEIPGPEERKDSSSLQITAFPSFDNYVSFSIDPARRAGHINRTISPNLWYALIDLSQKEPDLSPKQKGARLRPLIRHDSIHVNQKIFQKIEATLHSLSNDLPDYSGIESFETCRMMMDGTTYIVDGHCKGKPIRIEWNGNGPEEAIPLVDRQLERCEKLIERLQGLFEEKAGSQ